jgi:fructose-bisphosphate aldolase class II
MAIAVGNIHRLREPIAQIDYDLLSQIEACTSLPLVIHGTTGISETDLRKLKLHRISKFNIGTTMRMRFARSLRASLARDVDGFDRLTIMRPVVAALQSEAMRIFTLLGQD